MSEIEHLDDVDRKLQTVFDVACAARNDAQAVMTAILDLKSDLLQRKITIQRAELKEKQ